MKKLFTLFFAVIIITINFSKAFSQQPQVTLKATNFTFTDSIGGTDPAISGVSDALTFDIYLLVTGGADPFQYALGQFYLNLNVESGPLTLLQITPGI